MKGRREQVEQLAYELGFKDLIAHLDESPAQLSGGQRKRLAFLRGIIHEPRILIADEPLASVDRENAELIASALKNYLSSQDKTVILVVHDRDHGFFEDCEDGYIINIEENRAGSNDGKKCIYTKIGKTSDTYNYHCEI